MYTRLAMGKLLGRPPGLGERRPHHRDLLGEPRGRRRPGAEEPVAPADRAPQRRLAGRAEPQRRVGLLERLGLHRLVLELPELPVEGDAGLRPQRLHQLDALGEPRDVPPRIHAEGGERPARAAGAHADLDPAPAELVQRAQALGQVHRAVQGGHEHHAAQPQPLACTRPRRSSSRSARAGSRTRAAVPASTRCRSPAPRPGPDRPGRPRDRTRRRSKTAGSRSRTS